VVQEASEKETWSWMPDEHGLYIIEVEAVDEKHKKSIDCFVEE